MFPHLGMQASLSYQVFLPQECFQSEKTADVILNCSSLTETLAEDFSFLLKTTHSHKDMTMCPATQESLTIKPKVQSHPRECSATQN